MKQKSGHNLLMSLEKISLMSKTSTKGKITSLQLI